MQDYVKRMITEKEDLEGKIKKLKKALDNTGLYKLNKEQESLLNEQLSYMEKYKIVLIKRIDYETR